MDNEQDEVIVDDVEDTNEEEVEEVKEEVKVEKPQETLEQKRARLQRQLEQTNKKLGIKPEPAVNTDNLSQADIIYIAKADIHEDDISDVTTYAKKMGVSVKEAHEFMKPILEQRQEERKTAAATQTRGGTQGPAKTTPEAIIKKAEEGKISEDEIDKLAEAQMEIRLKGLGK